MSDETPPPIQQPARVPETFALSRDVPPMRVMVINSPIPHAEATPVATENRSLVPPPVRVQVPAAPPPPPPR